MNLRSPFVRLAVALLLADVIGLPLIARGAAAPPTSPPSIPLRTAVSPDLQSNVQKSMVRVLSNIRYPDPLKPWATQKPTPNIASGMVIEGKRILCSAHALLYADKPIQVQASDDSAKIPASILAIAPGIDIALLKLNDDSWFAAHPPMPRDTNLPNRGDEVIEFGYPPGGDQVSAAKGVIPDPGIEFVSYNYPIAGLRLQVNFSTNPNNNSGPVMLNNKMIALAFAYRGGADNIGYAIPCEEIDLFLKSVEDGRLDSKPVMFDEIQSLDNPALRDFLKLSDSIQGVLVHKPGSDDPGYPLKEWDVITRIGDAPIDRNGKIRVRDNLSVRFQYLLQKIARDGKAPLTIIRDTKLLHVELPVNALHPMVIPDLQGADPAYFVWGPVVFSSASLQFMASLNRGSAGASIMSILSASGSPLVKRLGDTQAFEGEELVVIPEFFPHALSDGYSDPRFQVVKSVNGVVIKNLKHLVQLLRDAKDEFISIAFDSRHSETLVFRRADVAKYTGEILQKNQVTAQGSTELMALWNSK
jgi:S1-C subfamily serine protease